MKIFTLLLIAQGLSCGVNATPAVHDNYTTSINVGTIIINVHPVAPAYTCFGSDATLMATATGADMYYWQENIAGLWQNINEGSMLTTGGSVSFTIYGLKDTKQIRCVFSNSSSISVASNTVVLVPQQPAISVQPLSQSNCSGNTIDFNISTSTGSTYTWQRKTPTGGFSNVSGTINSVISNGSGTSQLKIKNIGNAENPHLSQYFCVVTNSNGCINYTNVAYLTVNSTTNIADSPIICEGGSTSFVANLVGDINSIKWQKGISETSASTYTDMIDSSPNIIGTKSKILKLSNLKVADNNSFYRVSVNFVTNTNAGVGSCTQTQAVSSSTTGKLTVKALPLAPIIGSFTRCGSGSVLLTATTILGPNEVFRWYNESTTMILQQSTANSYTTNSLIMGNYVYYLSIYNTTTACESPRVPVNITVNPLPSITIADIPPICNDADVFDINYLSIQNTPNKYSITVENPTLIGFAVVENAELGVSPIRVTIPTNSLPNTYQLALKVINSQTSCVSNPTIFNLKINQIPVTPSVSPVNICQNTENIPLTATAIGTNTLVWYGTDASGGSASNIAPTPNATILGTSTYYVSQKDANACESKRIGIEVLTNPVPAAPEAAAEINFCKNGEASPLTATALTNNTLLWYDANDQLLTAAPTPNTAMVSTQVFKVSQKTPSPAFCESPKTTITIHVFDIPALPMVVSPLGYCQNAATQSLEVKGINPASMARWYDAKGTSPTYIAPIPSTKNSGSTIYLVSQQDLNSCESPKATIEVVVTPTLNVSLTGNELICSTGEINKKSNLIANPTGGNGIYNYQWANTLGAIAEAVGNSYEVTIDKQTVNREAYSVAVSSAYCTVNSVIKNVAKNGWVDIINAENSISNCGKTAVIIANSTTASGVFKWYKEPTDIVETTTGSISGNQNQQFNTNITENTSYYIAREQSIFGVNCQTNRLKVELISKSIAAPIVQSTINYCQNTTATSLIANGSNLLWYLDAKTNSSSSTAPLPSTAINGTKSYYVSQTLNGCESPRSEIKVIVNALPIFTTQPAPQTNCKGLSVNFSGNVNATASLQWQFRKNSTDAFMPIGSPINAGSLSFGVANVGSSTYPDGAEFRILATDANGCIAISNNAKLRVNAITGSIPAQTKTLGSTVQFDLSSLNISDSPLAYQWEQSSISSTTGFSAINEANETIFNINSVASTDGNKWYRPKITFSNTLSGTCTLSPTGGKLTISDNIPPIIMSDKVNICLGDSATLTASTCTGIVTWSDKKMGSKIVVFPLVNTVYTAVCTQGSYVSPSSNAIEIKVNEKPNSPVLITELSVCKGKSTTLESTNSCAGNLVWYDATNNTAVLMPLSPQTPATYYAKCTVGTCISEQSNTLNLKINVKPDLPQNTSPTSVCEGTTLQLSGIGNNLLWYNANDAKIASRMAPSISSVGIHTYWLSQTNELGCESERVAINTQINAKPNITIQPSDQTDCIGNSVVFTVGVTAINEIISYEWQRKKAGETAFSVIEGVKTASLSISNIGDLVNPSLSEYRCVLSTNNNCSVISNIATLSVNNILGVLESKAVCEGQSTRFDLSNFSIIGKVLNYQWQKRVGTSGSWLDLSNSSNDFLVINQINAADAGYFRCKVIFQNLDNSTCIKYTSTSNGAKLSVNPKPALPINNTPTSVCTGNTLIFGAVGTNLQWYSSNTSVDNTTNAPQYKVPGVYTAYVSQNINTCESDRLAISAEIRSTVVLAPTNQTPAALCAGAILNFSAIGKNLLWYNAESGGVGNPTAPAYSKGGTYVHWVSASQEGCESSRTKIEAKLTEISIETQPADQTDCKGNSVRFSVVTNNSSLTYQWQRMLPNESEFSDLAEDMIGISGVSIENLTISSLGIHNLDKTQFRAKVISDCPTLSSNVAILNVNSLVGSLPNISICEGQNYTMDLMSFFKITGIAKGFQWQYRNDTHESWSDLIANENIQGVNTTKLIFNKAVFTQTAYYRCAVLFDILPKNGNCTEFTDATKFTVSAFPPPPVANTTYEYCQNSKAQKLIIHSSDTSFDILYYVQATGGVGSTKNLIPSTQTAGSYYYYAAQTKGACESSRTPINIIIHPLPPRPLSTTPLQAIEGIPLTFSANGNILLWYSTLTDKTPTYTPPVFTTVGIHKAFVTQVDLNGCESNRTEIIAQIMPILKITKQPISQIDCSGNSVTFSLSAKGNGVITYQWQRKLPNENNFHNIANANANTLTIKQVGSADAPDLSNYRCVIKDVNDSIISSEGTLSVNSMVGTFDDKNICEGNSLSLNMNGLKTSGTIASYQWQKRKSSKEAWFVFSNEASATFEKITREDSAQYRLHIIYKNSETQTCSINSNSFRVNVLKIPATPKVTSLTLCQDMEAEPLQTAALKNHALHWWYSEKDTVGQSQAIVPTTDAVGNFTYFVSQYQLLGCESQRIPLEVSVKSCIAEISSNCEAIIIDSVKGNQWFDFKDKAGNIYASLNPNGQDLGKVSVSPQRYGTANFVPTSPHGTKILNRYFNFQAEKSLDSEVSVKIYYTNHVFNTYTAAINLPNIAMNDLQLVQYRGINQNCTFEDNDNFENGESILNYKNINAHIFTKNSFFLQFNTDKLSEMGATTNMFSNIKINVEKVEDNKTALIKWQAEEINPLKYIIQRSDDSKKWIVLGEIKAQNTSNANYEFKDYLPLMGNNFYRIIFEDLDGTKKIFDPILLEFTENEPICIVYPNPIISNMIQLYVRNIQAKEIKVYNEIGQEISTTFQKNELGRIQITLNQKPASLLYVLCQDEENNKRCINRVISK